MKSTTAFIFALAASANALGINCRGSGLCPSDGAAGNLINLKAIVDGIQPRGRSYSTGQQIACTGSLCAFYQNGATGTAEQASGFMQALLDHGFSTIPVPPRGARHSAVPTRHFACLQLRRYGRHRQGALPLEEYHAGREADDAVGVSWMGGARALPYAAHGPQSATLGMPMDH
ncbi:hypothetical protein Purlil1_12789 [Purpureocillium lilacinum]|uniref:Killer toxin Kp4 domain-containing protein n=1 Tax=Purpureocillium lilacinum TaxID=33203 RepID=A0ABR0BFU5_PURLI|nr:hypothetical protein Purlil1_12789 [Purpureocillium lilacinum]